jgi:peroxiredoxin
MQESSVPPSYGVESIPSTFLIDPEGKIAAKNLYGLSIRSVVRKALAEQKVSAK